MRDHGGNLDAARARFGGDDWIDLSTGINRRPWPVPDLPARAWTDLPTAADHAALMAAARAAFGTAAAGLALNGAQAAIQLIPHLDPPGGALPLAAAHRAAARRTAAHPPALPPAILHPTAPPQYDLPHPRPPRHARVVAPTYNEHAACLRAAGWQVDEVAALDDLAGAELGVVVNPNNPDGRHHDADALRRLSQQVGRLVVDESFADADPSQSLAAEAGERLIVLRSFGKFWGLAGLRLGFAFADADSVARMQAMAGPWPVSGPAIQIGRLALADTRWRAATAARLAAEAGRLDALVAGRGWSLAGGTALFRTYVTPDAVAAQEWLAAHRIWSRIFPWSPSWLRLGLPGLPAEWNRLAVALA